MSFQEKGWIKHQIRALPLPFTSFPIRFFTVIQTFRAVQNELTDSVIKQITCSHITISLSIGTYFPMAQQPLVSQGLLIIEATQ
jgi:hypothetical protein